MSRGDLKAASRLVQDSITMLFVFLLPATVGVVMVGEPLYTVFYGKPDSLAMGLFVFAVLQSTILGLYMVLSPMLQAMFRNRKAVLYFIYGSIAKASLANTYHRPLPQLWSFDFHNHRSYHS